MALQPPNKTRALILDTVTPILIVLVFGGVVIPAFLYLIEPQMREYFSGGAFHRNTQADILKNRETYLGDLRGFYEFYKDKGLGGDTELTALVPAGGKTEELFGVFEAAGQEFGASLQVIDIARTPSAKTRKESIQDIMFTLKYAGVDYETFKKLLAYFETSQRLTDITAISFDPVGRFASITVKVYYTQEKKK